MCDIGVVAICHTQQPHTCSHPNFMSPGPFSQKGPDARSGPVSTNVEKNYAMALLTIAAKLSALREAPPTSAPSTSSFSRKPAMFSGLAEPP